MEVKWLLKEKKFWVASFLIAWAAGLQGHMMWLQRQETFKQKFGTSNEIDIDGFLHMKKIIEEKEELIKQQCKTH